MLNGLVTFELIKEAVENGEAYTEGMLEAIISEYNHRENKPKSIESYHGFRKCLLHGIQFPKGAKCPACASVSNYD